MPPRKPSCELFAVEIRTVQWQNIVDWYRNVLGLRVLVRVVEDRYALLSAGETRLVILGRDEISSPERRVSLAFEVDQLPALAAMLRESGTVETDLQASPEGFTSLMARDPDGNRLRLFSWPQQ